MLTKKNVSFKSKTKKELDQKIHNFNQEIYELDIKNKEISTKIECFKDIHQYFENQKKQINDGTYFEILIKKLTKCKLK